MKENTKTTPVVPHAGGGSGTSVPATNGGDNKSNKNVNKNLEGQMKSGEKPSLEASANFLSRITYSWVGDVLSEGHAAAKEKGALEYTDLWDNMDSDTTAVVYADFQRCYLQETECTPKGSPVNIVNVLKRQFGKRLLLAGIVKYFNDVWQFITPLAIMYFLDYIARGDASHHLAEGFYILAVLVASIVLKVVFENCYFHITMRNGTHMKLALTRKIFDKSLRLSPVGRQAMKTGEIVNFMQLDTTKIFFANQFVQVIWSGIHQMLGNIILLYFVIGPATFAGVITMLVLLPIQNKIQNITRDGQKKINAQTDIRVKLTSEILQGIKAIKMYGWEESFAKVVQQIREIELKNLRQNNMWNAVNISIFISSPVVISTVTFLVYTLWLKQELSIATAFTTLILFNNLRLPLMMFPMAFMACMSGKLSLRRIEKYFNLDEIQDNYFLRRPLTPTSPRAVQLVDADFSWGGDLLKTFSTEENPNEKGTDKKPAAKGKEKESVENAKANQTENVTEKKVTSNPEIKTRSVAIDITLAETGDNKVASLASPSSLTKLDINIKSGELIAVVGKVGSGKSSLCSAILGDLKRQKGSISVEGRISYVAQTPWIFNATVKENILFGNAYQESKYKNTLKVCQLLHDLEILPNGDETEIGERGINLSGGQKQRVSIARAVYEDADVFIFDDPLSALDAEVSRAIFDKCIVKHLAGKTRILMTNKLEVLNQCDYVINLRDSTANMMPGDSSVMEQGKFREIMSNPASPLGAMMKTFGFNDQDTGATISENAVMVVDGNSALAVLEEHGKQAQDVIPAEKRTGSASGDALKTIGTIPKKSLVKEETKKQGAVMSKSYIYYVTSSKSVPIFFGMLAAGVFQQVFEKFSQWWLGAWSQNLFSHGPAFYMGWYAVFGFFFALLAFMRAIFLQEMGMRSSRNLHNDLFMSVLHAPLCWFDVTPSGRILNRFSQDVHQLDEELVRSLSQFSNCLLTVVFLIIAIAVALPWFLVPLVPMTYMYIQYVKYYNTTNRELKRIEATTRSPMFSLFSEVLNGLTTVRAYNRFDTMCLRIEQMEDGNNKSFWLMKCLERWLSFRLDLISLFVLLVTCIIILLQGDTIPPSLAALAITQALATTGILNWLVRMAAESEAQMNCVERIMEFSTEIPQEKSTLIKTPLNNIQSWPRDGSINIVELCMRYRDELDLTLKGINVSIQSGQKVGVCGRTGSGKSSLLLCLLRLVEAANGSVVIGGEDISKIPLSLLRTKISIIPQECVLFSGSFRFNLDPFKTFSDREILDVVEKVGLREKLASLNPSCSLLENLNSELAEGGENFSQGQRQLICLARALLRKSKILLLDEATSSVDYTTDRIIQNTIRTEFSDCTILTIAHRLNTIVDSDKVLVLSDGKVAEFDVPYKLMTEMPQGIFNSLVKETGQQTYDALFKIAKEKAEGKKNQNKPNEEPGAEIIESDMHNIDL